MKYLYILEAISFDIIIYYPLIIIESFLSY